MHYTSEAEGRQCEAVTRQQILTLSAIYNRISEEDASPTYYRRAGRVYQCRAAIWEVHDTMGVHYETAYACGDRMCPACARSRSLRAAANAAQVAKLLCARGQLPTSYHVVLTIRNINSDALRTTIGTMIDALRWMLKRRTVAPYIAGWARNIEITYSHTRQDFHPHVHLLVIPAEGAADTIACSQWWAAQWADALAACGSVLDYEPICHSVATWSVGALAEVSKYITKLSAIYTLPQEQRYEAVKAIDEAVRGRKLLSYGGIWAATRRELRQRDDIDTGDQYTERVGCTATYLVWAGMEYKPID